LTVADQDRRRARIAGSWGLVAGALAFFAVLLDFGTNLGRTALSQPYASNFFELQADAFRHGHLYVPSGSLGIEGFVHHGHTYMYFGPLPALLRLPVMLVTRDFDGRMTLAMMAIAFSIYAVMVARLTWLVRRLVLPGRPLSITDATLGAVFIALATGGTVLTFDASLPWAYHEVYLWQSAILVSAVYWLIRAAAEPSWPALRWLGFLALCAVLTRTTGGFGLVVALLVQGAWFWLRPRTPTHRARAWALVGAALLALAVGVAYNLAKFGTPFMFPLQEQVWTQVNAHRRVALAANGGGLTGPQFFWTGLANYFSPGGIRFVDYFPWVTLPAHNARAHGGAVIDQSYRTGSVTAFSTLLLLLSVLALPVLVRDRRNALLRTAYPALLGTFLVTGGVMGYGYVAYRYTSDFVPALVLFGVVGLWGVVARVLARLAASRRRPVRWAVAPVVAGVSLLTVFAIGANMSVGYAAAATTYRGPPLARYLALQNRLSGGPGTPFASLIGQSGSLPAQGETDGLHITGACDELFFNTGDATQPWVEVAARNRVVTVRVGPRTAPARVPLWKVRAAGTTRAVWIQSDRHRGVRVYLHNEGGRYYGPWVSLGPSQTMTVGMSVDSALGYLEVSSSPGGFVGFVPYEAWNRNWVNRPGTVSNTFPESWHGRGLFLQRVPGVPPLLCEQIAHDNGIGLTP
jgi:hypothetical protein